MDFFAGGIALKSSFFKLLISLMVLLFNASAVHASKYFVNSLDTLTEDPFGVIEFGANMTKVIQVTYLEDETCGLYKEILQALLKATFSARSKDDKTLVAKMNNLPLTRLLGQNELLNYIKEFRLEKNDLSDTGDWVLNVVIINKDRYSGNDQESSIEFNLDPYTPRW